MEKIVQTGNVVGHPQKNLSFNITVEFAQTPLDEKFLQDFHLIRASQARPFLLSMEEHNAPVETLAREAGLPLSALMEQPDGVIGEYALWKFIEAGGRISGCELLGYECAESYSLDTDNHLGDLPLRLGNNLERTLGYFNEDVLQLSTASYYTLDRREGNCWFRRIQAFGPERASWQAELYTVSTLLQVIRIHAGEGWLPPAVRFSSRDNPQPLPPPWRSIAVEWGADATGLQLPDAVLALPPTSRQTGQSLRQIRLWRPDFKKFVSTQVAAGCIGIDNAARQTGISVSTLQRILNASGTTYQDMLDEIRHKLARDLLENTTTPVAAVASALGYTHPGNFSRAFIRWEEMSPAAYRAQARSL